ncbi:sulfite exporter TauE/SafE family protein [Parashewanella spongiae]|uniref:Sulfite exporter TauE/SafE family protein n=1 Tax=Parashewanella spongiae TaxID=342950 RepID=A0A3A6U9E3_9GAMM|nr:sulfite exporter TauE/SafE family protein [Parashewanella spongiae]MCL1077260.1 sulfite exporter TauE/SafE family protein [Parashewanella spongiae]RJY18556.1 sulfite exporter TauE/SafE family protein [Parashewanella spongiae]
MINFDVSGALLVGLMGAGHCFGMCGGLVAAFSSQTTTVKIGENLLLKQIWLQLSYNFGRIVSYSLAGAIVGGSAASLGSFFEIDNYLIGLRIFAGLMMIITGLYVSQIWFGLTKIEIIGKFLWKFIQPFATKLLPIQTRPKAIIAGLVWGWLPCGLVYSMLTWAVASGSALDGATIMAAFGLGTLPSLLAAGAAAKTVSSWLQQRAIKVVSGVSIILFGIHTLFIAVQQLS